MLKCWTAPEGDTVKFITGDADWRWFYQWWEERSRDLKGGYEKKVCVWGVGSVLSRA